MRRITITIVAIAIGLLVALAVFLQTQPSGSTQPGAAPTVQQQQPTEAPDAPDAPADGQADDQQAPTDPQPADTPPPPEPAEPRAEAPRQADTADTTGPTPTPIEGLHVLPAERSESVTLGSDNPDDNFNIQVELTHWYASVQRITLADYREMVDQPDPYTLLQPITVGPPGNRIGTFPYAARAITVNGQRINLHGVQHQGGEPMPLWELIDRSEPDSDEQYATYRLRLADAQNQPVVEIRRTYRLAAGSYDLRLDQRAINLTDQPQRIQWTQNIQGDLRFDRASYLGDRRTFVTGYFPVANGRRYDVIYVDDGILWHTDVTDETDPTVWPVPGLEGNLLAWLASENRYFTVVTHPDVPPTVESTSQVEALEARFPRVDVTVLSPGPNASASEKAAVLMLGTDELDVAANGETAFDLGIYAGPRESEIFSQQPYAAMHFDRLVRYTLGGPCAVCTFQWLANGLLAFLAGIHWVFADWGVAIILLVLVVRLLLHPITKRSQVNMMKMSKQMQTLQPEIQKLRTKYADDQQKLNQEMMKLYREKGVNPMGMLGCLPMFLQMPIWIALYAMLYFAIELRHEPAFYDVFHRIGEMLGFSWYFLHDLSAADNFIRFVPPGEAGFRLDWIPFISPTFAGINLLPLLMAVVFFFQQKLTMPPPTSDQAAQQQRIMRIMVLIFPFMLYSAPSGLTLYILASTFGGIIDSYFVRKHVREQEEAGTLFQKKERKPGGVMDRIAKRMEAKQQELQKRMEQQQQPGGGGKNRKKKSR